MVGLTTLGLFRTAISLVAVVCGIWAFARYKKISLSNRLGQLCLASTLLTAVTALGIFQHGAAAARAGRAHARGAGGRRQRGDPSVIRACLALRSGHQLVTPARSCFT